MPWLSIEHKCEVTLSHFIALYDENYNVFGHDQATTLFYNACFTQAKAIYSHNRVFHFLDFFSDHLYN